MIICHRKYKKVNCESIDGLINFLKEFKKEAAEKKPKEIKVWFDHYGNPDGTSSHIAMTAIAYKE